MYKKPISILDFETTGTNYKNDRVIEVGILRVEDDKVVAEYEPLINPKRPINQFVQRLTGINNDDVSGAPEFGDVKKEIEKIMEGTIMVAHNAIFDVSFLLSELENLSVYKQIQYLCSVQLSRRVFSNYASHSLDAIISRYNLKVNNRHRALDDSRYVYELLKIIKSQYTPEVFNSVFENLIKTKENKPLY